MHRNPNEVFVWLYILNIYRVFLGPKCFSFFWHTKQRSSVTNTAFWAPPTEIQSFHVNRCLRKCLEGFILNQLSDWKISEHAVRIARDLQTCLSSFHSHRHTFTLRDSPGTATQGPGKLQVSFLKVKYHMQPNWAKGNAWQGRMNKQRETLWLWPLKAVLGFAHFPGALFVSRNFHSTPKHLCFQMLRHVYCKWFLLLTNLFSYFETCPSLTQMGQPD